MRKLSENMVKVLAYTAGRVDREEIAGTRNYYHTECALVGRGLLEWVDTDERVAVTDAGREALDALGIEGPVTEPADDEQPTSIRFEVNLPSLNAALARAGRAPMTAADVEHAGMNVMSDDKLAAIMNRPATEKPATELIEEAEELVTEIEQRHPELTRDQAERLAKSGDAVSVVCMACGDSFATLDESSQHDHIRQAEEPVTELAAPTMHARTEGATVTTCGQDATAVGATPMLALVDCPACLSATAPTLNDFEGGCDVQPRCAFCTNTYDECTCEFPPVSVTLERKLAERRAAGGATFEQRTEIVRLAASRNVPAALEPVVTAATAVDGVLAYDDALDAIGRLLRAPGQVHIGNKIDAYKRQTGRPILTPKQARRLNKKLRRDLVHPR